MRFKLFNAALVALALTLAACSNNGGGEAGTPAQNVPEAEPEGVGGTSNQ